jgi:hypothetical protein
MPIFLFLTVSAAIFTIDTEKLFNLFLAKIMFFVSFKYLG